MENLNELGLVELNETNLQEINGGLIDIGGLLDSLLGEGSVLGGLLETITSLLESIVSGILDGDIL